MHCISPPLFFGIFRAIGTQHRRSADPDALEKSALEIILKSSPTPAQDPMSTRYAWRVAALAGMASYLDAGSIVTSGTALVLYKDRFGLSLDQIGQLSFLLTFLFAFGALVGGRLGDRFGRRKVFTITLALLCVGISLMAFADRTSILYIGTGIIGLCIGADLPVSMAMIAEEAPPGAKGKMVAFSHALWMLAIVTVSLVQTLVGHLGATGARIMWLHLLVVAVIVVLLRAGMRESAEWSAAKGKVRKSDIGAVAQLAKPPYLAKVVSLALFYGVVNLSANTSGQFGTLLYTRLGGITVSEAGTITMGTLGVGLLMTFAFMRIVDRPNRMAWFLGGGVIYIAGQTLPLVFGFHAWTLIGWTLLSSIGGAFAGEPMWKIWSQELFPTLLRTTAQGATTFFTRVLAALAALVTPHLLEAGPDVLFMTLTGAVAATTLLGWLVIRRMPLATT